MAVHHFPSGITFPAAVRGKVILHAVLVVCYPGLRKPGDGACEDAANRRVMPGSAAADSA